MNPPLQRCLDILELLADAPEGLGLSAIGARLGLPKSATHRLLTALGEREFVSQDPLTQHYALTMKLAALGFRYLAGTRIEEVSQPVLDRLAAKSGELARLAIVEGKKMTWVAKAQGAMSGLRYDANAGRDVMLHATAVGKVWLASLAEPDALTIVARAGFAGDGRLGPRAVRTLAAMRAQLRETSKRGYGEAVDEGEPGVAAIAASIREQPSRDSPVVGTVSVAGPLTRLTGARRATLSRELLSAARELTLLWPVREQHRRTKSLVPVPSVRETADVA